MQGTCKKACGLLMREELVKKRKIEESEEEMQREIEKQTKFF